VCVYICIYTICICSTFGWIKVKFSSVCIYIYICIYICLESGIRSNKDKIVEFMSARMMHTCMDISMQGTHIMRVRSSKDVLICVYMHVYKISCRYT
jgi:hypothetical protein